MRLTWRDVAPGPGPAINTSLTAAETEVLRDLVGRVRWVQHEADCSLRSGHHLTCTCGGYSRPRVTDVLEIGSAYGYSAIVMALAGGTVYAVDPHVQMASHETMLVNLGFYGVADRVTIDRRDSRAVLPELVDADRGFDLVWIDGDHAADMVEHDVTWARKLLRPTGTLACHDYDEETCPGVRVALDKLFGGPGTLTDTLAVYGPGEW